MMLRYLLILSLLSISISAQAIRHVGSGGGDAELALLEMKQILPVWFKACNDYNQPCWNGGLIPSSVIQGTAAVTLAFSETPEQTPGVLTLKNSDLYLADLETPKSKEELAEILVRALYNLQGLQLPANLRMSFLPVGKQVSSANALYVLETPNTDVLVGLQTKMPLHTAFAAEAKCSAFRVTALIAEGFSINCTSSGYSYQVYISGSAQDPKFTVRYDAGNDL